MSREAKPDDISDDVWEAALGLAETCAFDGYSVRKETNLTDAWAVVDELNAVLIARAIQAAEKRGEERERARCAQIADVAAKPIIPMNSSSIFTNTVNEGLDRAAMQRAELIAAAIRRGTP